MKRQCNGFSLIELLMALMVTMGLSMMMFRLFHQNERVVRDQTLIMEMQQTARVVASQIADEVRMAGQGVPVYAATFDAIATESCTTILSTSTSNRIDFRAGLSNAETSITGPIPIDFTLGVPQAVPVADGTGFSAGKFVYLFSDSTWLRAGVTATTPANLTLMPRDTGSGTAAVRFLARPTVALDEAVSIYFSGGSVRRATASDMSDPANPNWSAANEIGKGFSALVFTYYDLRGNAVMPTSLANRLSIARVDIQLTVQAAAALSNGTRPTYSLALRTIPRNVRIRFAQ